MKDHLERRIALSEEVALAIDLIRSGLHQLQGINAANDRFHLPMLLLANGFERLMKTILCYRLLEQEGRYPEEGDVPKTHDLKSLLRAVVDGCFPPEYLQRPVGREDLDFLENDDLLVHVLDALSDFGQQARYHNLNVVMGFEKRGDSPEQVWAEIEMKVLQEHEDWWERLDPSRAEETHHDVSRRLVIVCERLSRALARLFTLANLGSEAKVQTGVIGTFLFLRDDELGRRQYRDGPG